MKGRPLEDGTRGGARGTFDMNQRLPMATEPAYRILQIVKDEHRPTTGAERFRVLVEAERLRREARFDVLERISREMHDIVLDATDDVKKNVPKPFQHWAYDLRRKRMNVYGSLFRLFDLLHKRGKSKAVALSIVDKILEYVHALWPERTTPAAAKPDVRRIA